MFISIVRAQVKYRSFSFVNTSRRCCLLFQCGANVELDFLNNCSETKVHESHHSFFPESINKKLTFVVGI